MLRRLPLGQILLLDFKPSHFAVSADISVYIYSFNCSFFFNSLIARPNGNGSLIVYRSFVRFLQVFFAIIYNKIVSIIMENAQNSVSEDYSSAFCFYHYVNPQVYKPRNNPTMVQVEGGFNGCC